MNRSDKIIITILNAYTDTIESMKDFNSKVNTNIQFFTYIFRDAVDFVNRYASLKNTIALKAQEYYYELNTIYNKQEYRNKNTRKLIKLSIKIIKLFNPSRLESLYKRINDYKDKENVSKISVIQNNLNKGNETKKETKTETQNVTINNLPDIDLSYDYFMIFAKKLSIDRENIDYKKLYNIYMEYRLYNKSFDNIITHNNYSKNLEYWLSKLFNGRNYYGRKNTLRMLLSQRGYTFNENYVELYKCWFEKLCTIDLEASKKLNNRYKRMTLYIDYLVKNALINK
jgi:hypothetical protein